MRNVVPRHVGAKNPCLVCLSGYLENTGIGTIPTVMMKLPIRTNGDAGKLDFVQIGWALVSSCLCKEIPPAVNQNTGVLPAP